jgi:hypothetical protein
MAKHALLIGSPTYGLEAVESDLGAMADLLRRRGFGCRRCYREDATRAGILAAYQALISDTAQGDAVVVYFSGHGGLAAAQDDAPGRARRYHQFIVPWDIDATTAQDFRGITSLELSALLTRLTERTANVTVIFDCCHAAGMSRSIRGLTRERLVPRSLPRPWVQGVRHHVDLLRDQGLAVDRLDAVGNPRAVRLVATSTSQLAYEHSDEQGNAHGLLTWALCTTLAEAGGAPISWRVAIDRIRWLVQSRADSQRPEVEGPSDRITFEPVGGPRAGSLPVSVDGGQVFLGGGRLHGVEVGDSYRILPADVTPSGESRALAEGTVRRVETARSLLEVRFEKDQTGFPPGKMLHAVPARLGSRRWSVDVRGDSPALDSLREAIRSAGLIRVRDGTESEAPLAVVEEANGCFVVRNAAGRDAVLPRPVDQPAAVAETARLLQQLARARAVATLPGGEGAAALHLPYEVEWGKVVNGGRTPPPGRDDPLRVGERLYVAVRNLSQQRLFVHFIDVGISAAVSVLNRAHPSGVELVPGQEYVLGMTVDGRLAGLPLFWPQGAPQDAPRDETVVVLLLDQPCPLDAIEQAGARGVADSTRGGRFWPAPRFGRVTRDLLDDAPAPDVRYAVSPITFSLDPQP